MNEFAAWWPSARWFRSRAAARIVEDTTMRAWRQDPPNPFDPRKNLDAALGRCAPLMGEYTARALCEDGPRLADHIQQHLPEVVAMILDQRRRVVQSEKYHARADNDFVAAHHCASAIQITAKLSPDGVFADTVITKPTDPQQPRCCRRIKPKDFKNFWKRLQHLGIGERLYLRADEEAGGRRWVMRSTSENADHLRHKLHRADPFKWHDRYCQICDKAGIEWETTEPDQFPQH